MNIIYTHTHTRLAGLKGSAQGFMDIWCVYRYMYIHPLTLRFGVCVFRLGT